jgi:hypothetical protein
VHATCGLQGEKVNPNVVEIRERKNREKEKRNKKKRKQKKKVGYCRHFSFFYRQEKLFY